MEKEKTAMQIAIANVDQCLNAEHVKSMLEELLELERQQILDFAKKINEASGFPTDEYNIEQYYKQTYGRDDIE
jgi:hypothetical protein